MKSENCCSWNLAPFNLQHSRGSTTLKVEIFIPYLLFAKSSAIFMYTLCKNSLCSLWRTDWYHNSFEIFEGTEEFYMHFRIFCKTPHGPRLEPKVIWSERYISANHIHWREKEREREREKDLMYFVHCIIAKMKQ